ncbi:DNA-directed RNA polymerase I subunit rpa49 [Vermiconidia calcicola]|uniref:DNA-directed RNA polymerase I subunit rpa49 n=1 Tax=Vermiconidia calcicola TaxID=1690605 RepID=A0ACC3NJU1_9PEZI|nr:DNA-directed RNA polymerase I subunit rpa49 [Vermiconidia calcicola]
MAEKGNKKRKRQSNGIDAPNKKVAFDGAEAGRVKITYKDQAGLHPVVVSTPGITAPTIPFEAYTKPLSSKRSDHDPITPNTHDLLLHSQKHPRLDYAATPITLDQDLSHYIAIFDPATKQLQITPAHHLSLRSKLRSDKEDDQSKRKRTVGQQREELGREFGTKKAKKAIADKTVNAIVKNGNGKGKKDDVQDAILDSMADSAVPALKEEEHVEAALASKPIPKPNLAAETVEDVYSFRTLIPPSDARLVNIKEWMEKTQADEAMNFGHRFPAYRVQAMGKREDVLRLKALRYLTLLLEFHDALQNAGKAGKKVPKKDVLDRKLGSWPAALVSSVRQRFSNPSNELPKWHLQNFHTHMCALSLFVDGWTTDTTHLKDDLKLETKEIGQYFRELGCKVGPPTEAERERMGIKKGMAAATKIAKLKLPLDFPKARVGRKR